VRPHERLLGAVEVSSAQPNLADLVRGDARMREVECLRLVACKQRFALTVVPRAALDEQAAVRPLSAQTADSSRTPLPRSLEPGHSAGKTPTFWDSSGTHTVTTGNKKPACAVFLEADDGTRTHDLLHGKGWRTFAPVRSCSPKPVVCSGFEWSERTEANPSERSMHCCHCDHCYVRRAARVAVSRRTPRPRRE
jgi:hypothetical protein